GQIANSQLTLVVGAISAAPASFPNGMVGTPYSATLTASGGTAPYCYALALATNLPPGLSLSSSGTLSGTPAFPGLFTVAFTITDSASNTLNITRVVVIDNAAGQARAIGTTPDTVQLGYVLTAPAPPPIPIS